MISFSYCDQFDKLTKEEIDYLKSKKTLTTHVEKSWYPYSYYEDGKPNGFLYEYSKYISEVLGLEHRVKSLTFDEAIKELEKNNIDLILETWEGASKSEDIISSKKGIFNYINVLVSDKKINSLDQLRGKKVGAIITPLRKYLNLKMLDHRLHIARLDV